MSERPGAIGRREQRGRMIGWAGVVLALFIAVAAIRVAPYSVPWCGFLVVGAVVTGYAALRALGVVKAPVRGSRR